MYIPYFTDILCIINGMSTGWFLHHTDICYSHHDTDISVWHVCLWCWRIIHCVQCQIMKPNYLLSSYSLIKWPGLYMLFKLLPFSLLSFHLIHLIGNDSLSLNILLTCILCSFGRDDHRLFSAFSAAHLMWMKYD